LKPGDVRIKVGRNNADHDVIIEQRLCHCSYASFGVVFVSRHEILQILQQSVTERDYIQYDTTCKYLQRTQNRDNKITEKNKLKIKNICFSTKTFLKHQMDKLELMTED